MAAQLTQEQRALINDPETHKVLATLDESGAPHVVFKQSLYVSEEGNIHYLELLESSRTNRNLVRAIWFDRKVSIVVKGGDRQSFQVKGQPIEVHISGPPDFIHELKKYARKANKIKGHFRFCLCSA